MRARVVRAWARFQTPRTQRRCALAMVALGLQGLGWLLEDHDERLAVVEAVVELHYDVDELERAREHARGARVPPEEQSGPEATGESPGAVLAPSEPSGGDAEA